jgi:hypothetical protein
MRRREFITLLGGTVALAEFRPARGGSCACKGELPFRRIDPLNFGGCTAFDQKLSEGAVAAADVDPSQARARR